MGNSSAIFSQEESALVLITLMPFACLRQLDSFSFLYFPSSFFSSFRSYSIYFLAPTPLLACSNFLLDMTKKTKTRNHNEKITKTPCFGLRGWGVGGGKSFRAASSNQSNGFWESEGHKNRGNFSRKICAMLFREKMEINFLWKIGKVCPDCSYLINFRPCVMLGDCSTINTRMLSWTNVDNNVDKHVAHRTKWFICQLSPNER